MQINDLINHTSEWLKGTGPHSDVVISTYGMNELLGTKLRALYQRKKGTGNKV